jgi:hypothetical protein
MKDKASATAAEAPATTAPSTATEAPATAPTTAPDGNTTVGELITDAFAVLEELKDEINDMLSNIEGTNLENTTRNQTLRETADGLESLSDAPDVPSELADIRVAYEYANGKKRPSRAARAGEAIRMLQVCTAVLEDKDAGLAQELENTIDEAECLEFPGMYG